MIDFYTDGIYLDLSSHIFHKNLKKYHELKRIKSMKLYTSHGKLYFIIAVSQTYQILNKDF